ncbi:class I SAM-dependent methyltransferase [Prauserella cavernicola]|uniref:Class I SAM-dependent methyltransferase n=1 Tax=Prauserella cavernicola TaxID=2800127 RepID=A0A934QV80_9PSEU|nr:class I SAM-dependent methyltransferase [Prauserella cavernicola]MBK1788857.1 class I SAM-dependent methyltransferase [Prauserella cavernicola]
MPVTDFLTRTRASYDTIAADYAVWIEAELAAKPLDRAVLAAFAEFVRDAGAVADVGCGPGRITAHLHALGVPAFGIDLSPEMIARARERHPGLRFEVGSMTELALDDSSLGGAVAWYSLMHVPHVEDVLAEFHRVLAPGGHLQLAFPAGEGVLHKKTAGGHPVDLDFHQRHPDHLARQLHDAGLPVSARLLREPDSEGDYPETTPQAYLLARKPG